MRISPELSKKVLTVGLEFKNHRGGIGGVISTYADYFPNFKFISTYKPQRYKLALIPYFLGSCMKLLFLLATDKNIKIVHIHGAAKGSFYRKYIIFLLAKYVFRRRVIYHSHGSEFKIFYEKSNAVTKWLIKSFIEQTDLIICLSKQWESFFTQHFAVKSIIVLENIVEEVKEPVKRQKSSALIKVLFLGAIGHRKGIFDLLETLKDHKQSLEGRLQLIVGGNGEVSRFEEYIKANQLENLVRFEGWVTGEKKRDLLKESDVYILPSYNEGLPLSILEAMSYGLPVVSTAVGGTPEVVNNNLNGFLIQPGDKEAIYRSLQRFIDEPSLLASMGSTSLKIVQPYYSQNVIPKLQKIYEQL